MSYSSRRPSLRERASARNTGRKSSRSGASSGDNKKILKGDKFSARQRTDFRKHIKTGIVIGLVLVAILLVIEYFRA